jgi:hypothetical protein
LPVTVPPAAVLDAPIREIVTPAGNRATATFLGDGVWATSRHVLLDAKVVELGRVRGAVEELASGDGPSADLVGGDWVLFRSRPTPRPRAMAVDFAGEVSIGAEVYVVGYGWPRNVQARSDFAHVVRGEVVPVPAGYRRAGNVVAIAMPAAESYPGMSGAAVVLWDSRERTATIVAIGTGTATERTAAGDVVRLLATRPAW